MSFLCALALASTSTAVQLWIDGVVAGEGRLPSLVEVQDWTLQAMVGPTLEDADGWASRARWRGLVPRFDAAFGTDADFDIRDSVDAVRTTTDKRALGGEVRARWELGDLVFSDMELRANRESLARDSAARLALDRVTEIYFQRVALLLEQCDEPEPEALVRAARLEALLRAFTGGRARFGIERGKTDVENRPE